MGREARVTTLHDIIARVAPSDSRVLILGENGTGKELVARAIHEKSLRSTRPFIKVNSAAIPKDLIESEFFGHEKGAFTGAVTSRVGVFEQAQGGTLFLDEVGDLSLGAQAKLLRVLSANEIHRVGGNRPIPIDVRIIAASNKYIPGRGDQVLRDDLYHRLAVVQITVPPLRARRDEIPRLVTEFLPCPLIGVSDAAMKLLMEYDWPGNVRELQNAIEHACIMCDTTIRPEHLPQRVVTGVVDAPLEAPVDTLDALTRRYIDRVLIYTRGDQGAACRILGIHPTTLYRRTRRNRQASLGGSPTGDK